MSNVFCALEIILQIIRDAEYIWNHKGTCFQCIISPAPSASKIQSETNQTNYSNAQTNSKMPLKVIDKYKTLYKNSKQTISWN